MAVRTTSEGVAAIIEVDSDISLTPFIAAANELVTECCTSASYTATRLETIERWLAAHLYSIRDRRITREDVGGGVGANYESKIGLGFDSSEHGQMALRFDTEGGLAALDKRTQKGLRPAVTVAWMGTENEQLEDNT